MTSLIALFIYIGSCLVVWGVVEFKAQRKRLEPHEITGTDETTIAEEDFLKRLAPIGVFLYGMIYGSGSIWCVYFLFGGPPLFSLETDLFLVMLICGSLGLLSSLRIVHNPAVRAVVEISPEGNKGTSKTHIGGAITFMVIASIGLLCSYFGLLQ